jgi:hypothetical protein
MRLCQFEPEGDFMTCRVCGWRMRIHNPSLPPERYRARCGAADFRPTNKRKSVRHSVSKRPADPKQLVAKRRQFQLGTFVANCLKKIGIKQTSGCGCGRREQTLNRWGRRLLSVFRRR